MNNDMDIMVITGDFPPMLKGVGDYSSHLAIAIQTLGKNVKVVTTQFNNIPIREQCSGVDVNRIISNWDFIEIIKIIKELKKLGDNSIVNIQYYCPTTYGRKLMINFLPLILRFFVPKTRVVVTMHGFWEQSKLYRLRTLPMLRMANGVIYVDTNNKKLLSKYSGLPNNFLKYIQINSNIQPIECNELLRKKWRAELGLVIKDKVLCFFGAIGQPKGFKYLLEAVESINSKGNISLFLLAIGGFHSYGKNDKYQNEMRKLINSPKYKSFVKVIQKPAATDCSKYLHSSDLAVFPFINGVTENSGSTLAALVHGLPTIVTRGPEKSRAFFDNLMVPSVSSCDSEALANTIIDVLLSEKKMSVMKTNAIQFKNQITWANIANDTVDFYKSILAR